MTAKRGIRVKDRFWTIGYFSSRAKEIKFDLGARPDKNDTANKCDVLSEVGTVSFIPDTRNQFLVRLLLPNALSCRVIDFVLVIAPQAQPWLAYVLYPRVAWHEQHVM